MFRRGASQCLDFRKYAQLGYRERAKLQLESYKSAQRRFYSPRYRTWTFIVLDLLCQMTQHTQQVCPCASCRVSHRHTLGAKTHRQLKTWSTQRSEERRVGKECR